MVQLLLAPSEGDLHFVSQVQKGHQKEARNQDIMDMNITNLPHSHYHGMPSIRSVYFANEVEIFASNLEQSILTKV